MIDSNILETLKVTNGQFDIENAPRKLDLELSKKEYKSAIRENVNFLSKTQERLFAQGKFSLLLIFQAMDAAGKDSTIERIVKGINPQGVQVSAFKKPTEEELDHDYLWRIKKRTPSKGMIGVFNRSHYEEVLVTRVHPEFIVYQNLPGIKKVKDIPEGFWQERFDAINAFEKQLRDHGTHTLKFFLNVSKDEQKRRIQARMDSPEKHWKFKLRDIEERANWDDYQKYFEEAIQNTSTDHAPWFAIPADDKKVMRVAVGQIIREYVEKLPINWPASQSTVLSDIEKGRILLNQEK